MADWGIFIGWGNTVRGREMKSLEVFSEEYQRLNIRANLIVENFGAVLCALDGEVQRQAGAFAEAAGQLV